MISITSLGIDMLCHLVLVMARVAVTSHLLAGRAPNWHNRKML